MAPALPFGQGGGRPVSAKRGGYRGIRTRASSRSPSPHLTGPPPRQGEAQNQEPHGDRSVQGQVGLGASSWGHCAGEPFKKPERIPPPPCQLHPCPAGTQEPAGCQGSAPLLVGVRAHAHPPPPRCGRGGRACTCYPTGASILLDTFPSARSDHVGWHCGSWGPWLRGIELV